MSARPVVWITGASSGIGLAIATRLAAGGWPVAMSARDAESLEAARAGIGGTAIAVPADVTDPAALARAGEEIEARLGPVGALVANAGLNVARRAWGEVSTADFGSVIDANLKGVFNTIDTILPAMREAAGGRILLISSFAGWHVTPQPGPAYTASKAALLSLAQSLNMAEMASGISATVLCPGEVATPAMARRTPPPPPEVLARMLQPEDVAAAVAFVLEQPERVAIHELVLTPRWNTAYNRVPGPAAGPAIKP